MPLPDGAVVVGVDGSDSALRAVGLAARMARLLGCRLRGGPRLHRPELRAPAVPAPAALPGDGLRRAAELVVETAVAEAQRTEPDVAVTGRGHRRAGDRVLGLSGDADLIVLGDRGLGGFTGLLMGSVAVSLATYGRCPVLVARGRLDSSGPVVVGVDGSLAASTAIELALVCAAAEGAPLRAVCATGARVEARGPSPDPARRTGSAADPFDELDARQRMYPSVSVQRVERDGDPRRALIDESANARSWSSALVGGVASPACSSGR